MINDAASKKLFDNLVPIGKAHSRAGKVTDGSQAPAFCRADLGAGLLRSETRNSRDRRLDGPKLLSSDTKRAGLAIASARKLRGVTQRELAALLGVSTTTICNWERGHAQPRAKYRALLKGHLDELNPTGPCALEGPDVDQSFSDENVSDVLQACKMKIANLTGLPPEVVIIEMSVRLSYRPR